MSLITCTAITAFGLILFVWLGDRLQRSVEEWVEGLEIEDGRCAPRRSVALTGRACFTSRAKPTAANARVAATRKESGEGDAASSSGHVRTDDIAHRGTGL